MRKVLRTIPKRKLARRLALAACLTLPVGLIGSAAASSSQPVRLTAARPHKLWMLVTAYCPCKECCGQRARGITASGRHVTYNDGHFAAADTTLLPFGSVVQIPGYHDARPVEVIDRGQLIKGRRLDVFFKTHRQAKEWGRHWILVTIAPDRNDER